MLQPWQVSLGRELLPGGISVQEHEMTLIVGLQSRDEVVRAADSVAHDGNNEGYYKFKFSKLRAVGPNWVLGAAGTQIGYDLYQYIQDEGRTFNPKIEIGAHEYAARMRELYERHSYTGPVYLLLAGIQDGRSALYSWSLERNAQGQVKFEGALLAPGRAAIGANNHGALYFANAYHSPDLNTSQRILLAHLCVSEAAKHDPRVGGPAEVALVRESGVTFFSLEDLAEVRKESARIARALAKRIASFNPRIGGS